MDSKKTILVLPGTMWQVALIDKIREMGHRVLVVNPAPDSVGFAHADGFLQSDIFDKPKIIAYGKKNKIDAVMSDECDIVMNLIAELGKEFNVPTLNENTAKLFTDKFMMREFCKLHGLKYPEYLCCQCIEEAIEFFKSLGKPIIIKPLNSNASHGVFKITTEQELRDKFDESMSFSRNQKCIIAERFIEGTEFTVDGIKTPSRHYTLAISEKKHFKHNESIANELYFTHYNPNFDYDKLRSINDSFVMRSKLLFGFTHAEYKYEDGDFYLIEIAARGGGNMISSVITQFMSGHDTYKYLVNCAIGNIQDEDFSIPSGYLKRASILKFFSTPKNGGIVESIQGLDYLDSAPGIVKYSLNFKIGDKIQQATSDSARIGFYIACAETEQDLNEIICKVDDRFKIIVK